MANAFKCPVSIGQSLVRFPGPSWVHVDAWVLSVDYQGTIATSITGCWTFCKTRPTPKDPLAAKHADPWWFALRPATNSNKTACPQTGGIIGWVRPFQNPSSTMVRVKPCQAMKPGESHQVRNGPAYRRLAAEVMCQICAGNSWIRQKLSGIALVTDVIKSNWIPGHRFLCWLLMRNGDWKRLRNLESESPRGTWACHSLPTVLLISFRRWRGICFVKGDVLLQFANSEGLTFTERSKSQKYRRAT